MPFFFDLHVHSVRGSSDSSLQLDVLTHEAHRIGLSGVCLTEHGGWSDPREIQRLADESGLAILQALEVETTVGHVLVFGLDRYHPGISDIRELRRVVDRLGGFMILAHPFRNLFNESLPTTNLLYRNYSPLPATPQDAISHPAFALVDEVEIANGANTEQENHFAHEVARLLGRIGTGGSDAHSSHGLGKCVTAFHEPVRTEKELIEALRAGAFTAAEGLHVGSLRHLGKIAP
ncbi:MAG: hypothetical protein EXR67_05145 [Dehalococcoidia bacterium]|nr:hypothetical protein [Dehalococcoidia bacterium]